MMRKWQNKYIIVILIGIYLLSTMIFFVKSKYEYFHMPDKPYFFYIVQWVYEIILIISLINFNKNTNKYWLLLNVSSLGLIYVSILSFLNIYYVCLIEYSFVIEIISLFLLIYINRKKFINKNKVEIKTRKYITIFLIPTLISVILYFMCNLFDKYGIAW